MDRDRRRGLSLRALVDRFRKPPASETIKLNSANADFWADPLVKAAYVQMGFPRRDIETTIGDPGIARSLMDRVIAQWQALGSEPYWSNTALEEHKLANLDADGVRSLYGHGTQWMSTLAAFESRSGVKIDDGLCLELGCGVGLFTLALCRRFAKVIGVDVSSGGLRECERRAEEFGITNLTTSRLTSPEHLAQYRDVDFFLSLSTLQHNPPPIQKILLEDALKALKPGGFCLFQTPDWIDGYTFSSERFLANLPDDECDSHCLPKTEVLAILEANGMRLLDFAPDFTIEVFGSYTYFASKTLAPVRR